MAERASSGCRSRVSGCRTRVLGLPSRASRAAECASRRCRVRFSGCQVRGSRVADRASRVAERTRVSGVPIARVEVKPSALLGVPIAPVGVPIARVGLSVGACRGAEPRVPRGAKERASRVAECASRGADRALLGLPIARLGVPIARLRGGRSRFSGCRTRFSGLPIARLRVAEDARSTAQTRGRPARTPGWALPERAVGLLPERRGGLRPSARLACPNARMTVRRVIGPFVKTACRIPAHQPRSGRRRVPYHEDLLTFRRRTGHGCAAGRGRGARG